MTSINKTFEDFYYGIDSDFPLCCVLYFITAWEDFFHDWFTPKYNGSFVGEDKRIIFYEKSELEYHIERVLCPNCILKEFFSTSASSHEEQKF